MSFPSSIDDTWLGTPLNPAQYPGVFKGTSARATAGTETRTGTENMAFNDAHAALRSNGNGNGNGNRNKSGNGSKISCVNQGSNMEDWQRCDYSIEALNVGYRW